MAGVGIWLWSNPDKFGGPILCDPSLSIVGGTVRFSSQVLRIFSLLMYTLLLIPGVNLVPGFLFFLSLHILYNKSRKRHPLFWMRCQRVLHAMQHVPRRLRNIPDSPRRIPDNPSDEESQIDDSHRPTLPTTHPASGAHLFYPTDAELKHGDNNNTTPAEADLPAMTSQSSSGIHTSFLVVGLGCLAFINVLLLVDIELTLFRNKQLQSREEDQWGFGQVLALLLLVVPLRDFVGSVMDIRRKLRAMKQVLQRQFEKALRDGIAEDTLVDRQFRDFIELGVDPKTRLDGM